MDGGWFTIRHAKTAHGLIRYGKDEVVAMNDPTIAGEGERRLARPRRRLWLDAIQGWHSLTFILPESLKILIIFATLRPSTRPGLRWKRAPNRS
jgi:hypothetical protein